MGFPFYKQFNIMDCGPTCIRMVAKYYGKTQFPAKIRQLTGYTKEGVSLLDLSEAAEKIGFRTRGVQIEMVQLLEELTLPCILHWNQNHFVVLPPQPSNIKKKGKIKIADPGKGVIIFTKEEFAKQWISSININGGGVGTALLLEPTSNFYLQDDESTSEKYIWKSLVQYLKGNNWQLTQIFLALLITSFFQLIFPLLTQSIIDIGVSQKNLSYVTIVLAAQLMLIFSRTIIEFIRSSLLLNISVKLNFSLISDFWIKIAKLPISYFDSYHTGDTLQRLNDSRKIESFLTGSAISTFFSFFNFLIFAVVLIMYSVNLFFIFFIGSVLYFLWVRLFLRLRRKTNYQTFHLSAKENNASLQLIQGMQELKLNNAETLKRWDWENIQGSIFRLGFKNLSYNQIQQSGAVFINEGKNIIITFLVAKMVIQEQLSLGAMLAVQYIIGQLNSPIEQFVGFVQNAQDAKMSLERLNEIHGLNDEESQLNKSNYGISYLPTHKSILIRNLSFAFPGADNDLVLDNINLEILEGKTTAIVGVSGSGKTTLIKLLLKFYEQYEGDIEVGNREYLNQLEKGIKFKYLSPSFWRRQCGAVLQDGYIFNDTIAQNIAVGYDQPELEKLISASRVSNLLSFIESLPNGFNTKIGSDGVGISQGQKQRLLIARAIYKDPKYLFFDEATNALDANNEKVIIENLQQYFKGRTVIVVAHRLSTVKNADKIVVLHEGKIIEQGTHNELTLLHGRYFELVKNQLELGN